MATLSKDAFGTLVSGTSDPILVGFSAEWSVACGTLDELLQGAKAAHKELTLGKVDIDEVDEASAAAGVTVVPALLLYKGGVVVDRIVGLTSADDLEAMLAKHL